MSVSSSSSYSSKSVEISLDELTSKQTDEISKKSDKNGGKKQFFPSSTFAYNEADNNSNAFDYNASKFLFENYNSNLFKNNQMLSSNSFLKNFPYSMPSNQGFHFPTHFDSSSLLYQVDPTNSMKAEFLKAQLTIPKADNLNKNEKYNGKFYYD